jgi:hypothetical protein
VTHKERVLQLLSDGKPHTHLEGYALGVMLHSRAADLRRDGYDIRCWREGDHYLYKLVADDPPATENSPESGTDGSIGSHGSGEDQLVLTGAPFRRRGE